MPFISLDRRFFEWTEKEAPDPEMRRAFGLDGGDVDWDALLKKHRVVILAEAGSGKTTEIAERARIVRAENRYAFHASVEDVGKDGLEGSLSRADRKNFELWRDSEEEAWFFVDSIDEAKASGVRLARVARELADGISGAEDRAHVILSGRMTDWEFRKDLDSLNRLLPVSPKSAQQAVTAEAELLSVLRRDERHEERQAPPESAFVALLSPLDRQRVRQFALGRSTPNLEGFLHAVEAENLWHFARRPLDLDWLVRFWRSEGRLGSLVEMVDKSVTERLKESNTDRARFTPLDETTARSAVERIAAVMVFGRQSTVAIPDSGLTLTSDSALRLEDVLPDWTPENRQLLLIRPIFDPATLGRARFHNDNDGVVRGFLAAKWLHRLRQANLSTRSLFDLFFAKSYGHELIRPSVAVTAAWLSLWDADVAKEVVRRDPSVLLAAGDPASLPKSVREGVLTAVMNLISRGSIPEQWWDNDKLRRFAQPDMGPVVADLWALNRVHEAAANLLLRLVWLGGLKECTTLAFDAAFDSTLDTTTRVFAARALLSTGDTAMRQRYADFIMAEKATLSSVMIRDAVDELFPTFINVKSLVEILGAADITRENGGLGFGTEGPDLAKRLSSTSDLEELVEGLLSQVGREWAEYSEYPATKREEEYFPGLAEAALRLLEVSPSDSAPDLAVDAILRVCNRRDQRGRVQVVVEAAVKELRKTIARRRASFWRAAEVLRNPRREGNRVGSLWDMGMLGYRIDHGVEDIDWLLSDGIAKGGVERSLAVDAAVTLYNRKGRSPEILQKISEAVSPNADASKLFRELTERPDPSAEHEEIERKLKELDEKHAAARAERDKSWIDFIRDLQADAKRLEGLKTPLTGSINPDLFNLWKLLEQSSSRSRYAIDSVAPLQRFAGAQVAEAARAGLIAHWRSWSPTVKSQGKVADRNKVRSFDLMGLVGVTLEAAGTSDWATRLSSTEATRAANYGTLELNGFPSWMLGLSSAKRIAVRDVLIRELLAEISLTDPIHRDTLHDVVHGPRELRQLVAPVLYDHLENGVSLSAGALGSVLQVLTDGLPLNLVAAFALFATERFEKEQDAAVRMEYLASLFRVDPVTAVQVLETHLGTLGESEKKAALDRFLVAAFDESVPDSANKAQVSNDTLYRLLVLTFETDHDESARSVPERTMRKKDSADYVNEAHNAVFRMFVRTPGAATYEGLLRLKSNPKCTVKAGQLQRLAEQRALDDAEAAPWLPADALEFERHHETAPRTPKDLRTVLISRLEDMQHDLVHGDFGQGLTLKGLSEEKDVQNWVADRLRLKQGRSFSVEREPHVVDEKEPDIRCRAKASDASVAIEVKVAESWTLKQLDDALDVQLCGRYLRARDGRFGILLVVYQGGKPRGWKDKASGKNLSFQEVVERLSAKAAAIAGSGYDAPQPEVCVLDVSGIQ